MKLEYLPNEIILEIFDYLNAIHLIHAFHNVNLRLNKLLDTSFQSYCLDFRSISKYGFNIICQQHLPSIIDKVSSLHLADDDETPNLPKILLSNIFTLSRFTHLKALSLYSIQSLDLLNEIILQCHYITHLKLIQCFYENKECQLINNIWSLPKLIDCHIDGIMLKGICFSELSIKSLSIKYLSIKNIICNIPYLSSVFQQTPCLQRLCTTIACTEKIEKLPDSIPLLTKLTLSYHGSILSMRNIFQQMCNLHTLTINTSYLLSDGSEWENILVDYLPKLKYFRLKMSFQLPESNNLDITVDELLNTFRTDFWIKKHQWFVRCDWNTSDPFNNAILYTLPYLFDDFHFINESCSKSTYSDEKQYCSYDHVKSLQYENSISNHLVSIPIVFLNITHLDIMLPFNEKLLRNIPSLNHLKSLDVTLLTGESTYHQLQLLLNRAPHLHILRFSHLSDLEMILFKITNTSVRRLDFFTKESMLYSWYFNEDQCNVLANSSLGQQCQTLIIDIIRRTNVLYLINNMSNLRSLTFQCKDDKGPQKILPSIDDELIQWFDQHLPRTCSISRNKTQSSIIHVWIR
ncbi:unnamed protein product [Adineta steineri]|uniref:F-box domain-containing protein n=1 Tax=Adineta steineri TaxID=433720 RepID=A0A815ECG6_9BILA|nr:unnamed protein product [Adineta steineri]CAF3890798.1 unnamed protein product [Adineta steineri]